MSTLAPADLSFDATGLPRSTRYGDVYHSAQGGRAQARHVFLGGNDLPRRWQGRHGFCILECGFGLGLNFLETLAQWRADARAPARLHYVAIEAHPVPVAALERALAAAGADAHDLTRLAQCLPPPLAGVHRIAFDERVTLTLALGDIEAMLTQLTLRADAIYLDGFDPAKNPRMWSAAAMQALARLAAPGATLATWSVAGAVRAHLAAAGFTLEKRPGFAGKREMLTGRAPGEAPAERPRPRSALVIGAGLAGSACADRLAARGLDVEVLERHAAPAQEASGNASGLLHPVLNLADTAAARLSHLAVTHAVRHLRDLQVTCPALRWQTSGVLRLAQDARQMARFERILANGAFPADYLRAVDAAEAARLAARAVRGPGLWIAQGAWADPASVCRAQLARHSGRIRARYGAAVASVAACDDGWQALDASGGTLARADCVVLACAQGVRAFAQAAHLPLALVRGQVSYLPDEAPPAVPVCGQGYVGPLDTSMLTGICVGASFDHDREEPVVTVEDHVANLERLRFLLPGAAAGVEAAQLAGRAALRLGAPDRLPVVGALAASDPALRVLTALGARGLAWAPLCAELLAAQLLDEPWPLARELAAAVDAMRYATAVRQ